MANFDSELLGYSSGEIDYLVELLAAMKPYEEIAQMFLEFTAGLKGLSRKTLYAVSEKHKKRIKDKNEAYIRNEQANPLAHRRVRMDIAYKILLDCLKPRPINSIKTGDGTYEVIEKADNSTAINALKLVMGDLSKKEELKLLEEKIRGRSVSSETPDLAWEIDEGLDSESRQAKETEI